MKRMGLICFAFCIIAVVAALLWNAQKHPIPLEAIEGLDDEATASYVIEQTLASYQTVLDSRRLRDYHVLKAAIFERTEEQWIVTATYDVLPYSDWYDAWCSGNGSPGLNGWINNKFGFLSMTAPTAIWN